MKDNKNIKVSIVVTARNDDHGGGFLRRMQVFTNAVIAQCDRHKLKAELIVVEWNTMPDSPGLSEVLEWPEKSDFCSVRFIEVPPEIHNQYKYSSNLGLYQMIAKNVGFRRSRADYFLATNIDILISDELMQFMASDNLREKVLYRVDRYDIPEDIPIDANVEEQLEYCRNNLTRNNERDGTRNFMTGKYFPTYVGLYTDSTRLHFNACGDFTLMHRDDWYSLRGYPEFDMYSAHMDSVMLLMAYNAGILQEILPDEMQTYHIEHSSSMIAEKAGKLFKDLKSAGVPQIKVSQIEDWAKEMNRTGRPILFNGTDWGHVSEDLKDTYVLRALWDRDGNGAMKYENDGHVNPDYMSVIVAGAGNPESIERCLDSMASQTLPLTDFEVLAVLGENLANNDLIEKYRDKINLRIILSEGKGLSALYAAGITEANGKVVLFINHDSIAETNMLHEHWLFHKNNPPCNRDIWAHLNLEHSVMVGKREWDSGLNVTPLMSISLEKYSDLKDGDSLDWHYFNCDNLSCNRDFIIRYGNFDQTFNANGDLEMGYRLSRQKMKIIHNDRAKSYMTEPLTLNVLKEKAFAEGQFSYTLHTKYSDPEVQDWCGLNGARDRVEDLKDRISADMKVLEDASEINDDLMDFYHRIYEYQRARGLIEAETDKSNIINDVFRAKLFEKSRNQDKKSVLIISESLPLYDMNPDDSFLYHIIQVLAGYHSVTFLSRKGIEKGKYIEVLRKIGVSVFYDSEGLQEQAMVQSRSISHASKVDLRELLTHRNYDVILLHGSDIGTGYIHSVRDYSPQSLVIMNAFNIRAGRLCVYDEADLVIAAQEPADILMNKVPDLKIRILPGPQESGKAGMTLNTVINNLPTPQNKHLEKFRILPYMTSDSGLLENGTDLSVIYVLNDTSDTSLISFESILKYSNARSSKLIVALNAKRCSRIADRLEREMRYYFKYDNEKELNKYISNIINHCSDDYVAVVEDKVIVCPDWDNRLLSHLRKNSNIDIITARPSEVMYSSIYDFEKNAYRIFEGEMYTSKFTRKVNAPCLIINRSGTIRDELQDLKTLLEEKLKQNKVAEARDTLVFYVKKGLKEKHNVTFDKSVNKKFSVIIPAFNESDKISACLNSLFMQKDVDYKDFEIIVVYSGTDKRTVELLNSSKGPCSYRHYEVDDKGLAAALNYGIRQASGEYILFISEGAVTQDNLLYEHIKIHVKHKVKDIAVLGHITVSWIGRTFPFMEFMSKNPKLSFASPLIFNFNDISDMENAGHFYLPNVSIKRKIFQEVGFFDEEMIDEWVSIEFGSRLSINDYKVVYSREPLVNLDISVDLEGFLKGQTTAGKQFALMAYTHPHIWHSEGAKQQCLSYYLGKQRLVKRVREITDELEHMTEDVRLNYKYAGMTLLDKSYYILSNYYFAEGINEVICRMEGADWLSNYAGDNDIEPEDVANKNKAYEKLVESYWHIGRGDHEAFSSSVEQSSAMMEGHPSPYYAAGNYYFNLNEYKLAEITFYEGMEKRRSYNEDPLFPGEEETLFGIWLAMACIPQGKYKEAAEALEKVIAERMNMSEEQEALIYKCLDLSYKGLGNAKRAEFCRQEADRLNEIIKSKQELQSLESVSI